MFCLSCFHRAHWAALKFLLPLPTGAYHGKRGLCASLCAGWPWPPASSHSRAVLLQSAFPMVLKRWVLPWPMFSLIWVLWAENRQGQSARVLGFPGPSSSVCGQRCWVEDGEGLDEAGTWSTELPVHSHGPRSSWGNTPISVSGRWVMLSWSGGFLWGDSPCRVWGHWFGGGSQIFERFLKSQPLQFCWFRNACFLNENVSSLPTWLVFSGDWQHPPGVEIWFGGHKEGFSHPVSASCLPSAAVPKQTYSRVVVLTLGVGGSV